MEALVPKIIRFLSISVAEIEKNEGKQNSIVLSHNDLVDANFIFDEKNQKLQVIDFEYSGWNFYYYEIANFLCMIESTYLDEAPFFNYKKLEPQKLDKFLWKFYQKRIKNLISTNILNNVSLSFDKYKKNVHEFRILSHFFWIHLAIKTMYLDMEFDFKRYCSIKHDLIKETFMELNEQNSY